MNENWYSINAIGDTADVRIYGLVGQRSMGGTVNAADFVKELGNIKAKQINLRLNTDGGSIFEGVAIYNALKNHGARIVAHVDGLAASIGSFIAMAAHEIRIAKNAWMMIHNPKILPQDMAESTDLRRMADMLDKMRDQIAAAYTERTKLKADEIHKMMKDETWLTAAEAKAKGFADVITGDAAVLVAMSNLSAFNHVPEALKQAEVPPETEPIQAPEVLPSGDPAPAQPQEVTPMADTPIQDAPANTPAPATNINPQGDIQLPPATGSVQDAVKHFQNVAGPQYRKQGYDKGLAEGFKAATDRLKAIVDVCPSRPQMAMAAFLTGQSPEAVKLAFDEAARVESEAKIAAEAQQMEIARLNTLLSLGGHVGVPMDLASGDDSLTGMEPKAQATYEWDHNPKVRQGYTSKERYVNVRKRELTGEFRRQTASPK